MTPIISAIMLTMVWGVFPAVYTLAKVNLWRTDDVSSNYFVEAN